MSGEACQTAYKGKVPALKTLLTDSATQAAIDQLFYVDGYVSIIVAVLQHITLLIIAFPIHYCVPVRGACVDAGSVCVLHVSGSMCVYAYERLHTCWSVCSRFFFLSFSK